MSSSSITPGRSATLTAQIVSLTSGTPTGTVSFYDGSTLLGTSPLTSGSAIFRYAARAKRAQNKIERTESMVLYYLASHDLKKLESHEFTLKRNKNSQDSVVITQPDSIPYDLRRFEAKIDGPLWLDVIDALPKTLAEPLAASVKSSEPSNCAIKQQIAKGGVVAGASVKRGYHLRIE